MTDRGSTFRSLSNRNYRIYFFGQMISQAGTFMQIVGQSWLVLQLTGSGTALGVVSMLQYLPLLTFGGLAGVLVDRMDRRRLYLCTQAMAAGLALLLGIITQSGHVRLGMVSVLAFALGLVTGRRSCSIWWGRTTSPTPSASIWRWAAPAERWARPWPA